MKKKDMQEIVFIEVLKKLGIKEQYYNGDINQKLINNIYDECWDIVSDYENSLNETIDIIKEDFEKEIKEIKK